MMKMRSGSSDELRAVAAEFVRALKPGSTATILALSGDLGAGKTNFTQGAAEALGVLETVSSPTFVIEKTYGIPKGSAGTSFSRLIHIDAYRLKDAAELGKLGWDDLLKEPDNLILIEWPEHVEALIPSDAIRVRFDIDGDGRIITTNGGEENGIENPEI